MIAADQCYEGGTSPALRVVLATGESWVFPWSRFLHARFLGGELVLTFAEHRVEIYGRNLAYVFQQYVAQERLSMIREIPAEYAAVAGPKDTFISSIVVTQSN